LSYAAAAHYFFACHALFRHATFACRDAAACLLMPPPLPPPPRHIAAPCLPAFYFDAFSLMLRCRRAAAAAAATPRHAIRCCRRAVVCHAATLRFATPRLPPPLRHFRYAPALRRYYASFIIFADGH
jgi:hypothetical protein